MYVLRIVTFIDIASNTNAVIMVPQVKRESSEKPLVAKLHASLYVLEIIAAARVYSLYNGYLV